MNASLESFPPMFCSFYSSITRFGALYDGQHNCCVSVSAIFNHATVNQVARDLAGTSNLPLWNYVVCTNYFRNQVLNTDIIIALSLSLSLCLSKRPPPPLPTREILVNAAKHCEKVHMFAPKFPAVSTSIPNDFAGKLIATNLLKFSYQKQVSLAEYTNWWLEITHHLCVHIAFMENIHMEMNVVVFFMSCRLSQSLVEVAHTFWRSTCRGDHLCRMWSVIWSSWQ